MDVCYYNSQIKEELDGAADYIKRAINCKVAHPEWAARFAKMSEAELGHASDLIQIYEDDLKNFKMEVKPTEAFENYLAAESKSLHYMYVDCSARIRHMHDMFNSK